MPSLSFAPNYSLRIARISFADSTRPVNVLNAQSISELEDCVAAIEHALACGERINGLVIRSATPGMFIAGADIEEIQRISSAAEATELVTQVNQLFLRIENLPMPVVAAINGPCLGGGFELALACHYRVAVNSPKVKIGLPETQLGIMPGFGGTQRLPRLIGLEAAIKAITTARQYGATKAKSAGLVDALVESESDLLVAAESWIAEVTTGKPYRKISGRRSRQTPLERMPFGPTLIRRSAQKKALAKTGGHYPAIPAAIDAVLKSTKSLDKGLAYEAEVFGRLVVTPVARNLIGIYFLTQRVKKQVSGTPKSIDSVAVIGAGVMGTGIAITVARAGIPVVLKDIQQDALDRAAETVRTYTLAQEARGRMSGEQATALRSALTYALEDEAIANVDVIIETVAIAGKDALGPKQAVHRGLREANPTAVIASNTSSLSVTDLGDGVVGMHFFNPAEKMPLIEVIRGDLCSEDDVATIVALALRLKKTPIVVGDQPGFLVNRVLGAYFAEAASLAARGVPISFIDRAAKRFGMPMGPFRLLDEVGFDIASSVADNLVDAFGSRMATGMDLAALVQEGILGKKSDFGFYFPGGESINADLQEKLGIMPTVFGLEMEEENIVNHLMYAMLNELFWCIEDSVIEDYGFADLAMIFGTGFPPFVGGPFALADKHGLSEVIAWMDEQGGKNPRLLPCSAMREALEGSSRIRADLV